MLIFSINCGSFDIDFHFIIGDNPKEIVSKLKDMYGKNKKIKVSYFTDRGDFVSIPGIPPILWIPKIPQTPEEYGVLNHEISHLIFYIMQWANIKINEETEEVFSHQMQYLSTIIYEKISINNILT